MNLSALLGCLFSLQWSGLRQICAASQPPPVPEECITVPSPASGPGLEVPNLHIHACRVSTYKQFRLPREKEEVTESAQN